MTVPDESHTATLLDERTTGHGNETAVHEESHASLPAPILFIFCACAIGAASRTILKMIPQLPYTVVLLLFGALFGLISTTAEWLEVYTTMASMDPHTILHVFLPVLIFESAYAMEPHTFLRSFAQILVLAVFGLGVATALTAVFCKYVFSYQWGWNVSMMFGSLISATDPVAVVALLKELGASKQLGILLEGESLLNDGTSIVLFDIFFKLASGTDFTASDMVVSLILKAIVGPLFGFMMGKITIFWLANIFNDALTEITITLASTYVTFYVGEGLVGTSGVLAVVVLGVTMSSNRTSVSPEVETFLHRFWEMLAYLANTLIFILVGVVISTKAAVSATGTDIMMNIALYCAVTVIRAITIAMFSPILSRIGYGLTWKNSAVMVWGGLRGAVCLALALIASQQQSLDLTGVTQNKLLLHTAGIVMWTLVLNATTIQPLLKILGMSEISMPKRLAMASAVRNLREVANTSISTYKTDRFLADADWDIVNQYIDVKDPYQTLDEEAALNNLTSFERTSKCPKCFTDVPNEPSPKEWDEMRTEARLRLLKAEKISYWKQFEHGMLSREAVRKLVELVDTAADEYDGLVNIKEITKTWQIRGIYDRLRDKLERWQSGKPDANTIPPPTNRFMKAVYIACLHQAFEIVMNIVIVVNVVFILLEIIEEGNLCEALFHEKYGDMFKYVNYVFIIIYFYEASFKIIALRRFYFRSKWNWFDFIVLTLAIGDVILDFILPVETDDCLDGSGGGGGTRLLNPNLLKLIKFIKLLRLLRSFRLVKGLIPQLIDVVDHQINKNLRFGYDVGKGYAMGEEEVQNLIDHMIGNKKIAKELQKRLHEARLVVIKELGLLQKQHPGVAVSIKTQQAARRTLNDLQDKILEMRGEGVIDEQESGKLEVMVEMRMKKLLKIPPSIQPPPPEKIIGNLSWVKGDTTLIEYIKHNAILETMSDGEKLEVESDPKGGILVIISGLVKVDKTLVENVYVEEAAKAKDKLNRIRSISQFSRVTDYLSTGSVLGELSLLTGKPSDSIITCVTSVQMYKIPYEAIQAALELFTEEPSLEYRLWRVCAILVATYILKRQPHFLTWTHERLKMHLEKCILYIKRIELPDGGRLTDLPTFDINSVHMSDIILIHGVANDPDGNRDYTGPCYIPNKVDHLVLMPGDTDKHVLLIMPRDTNESMVVQSDPATGSATNIVVGNSVLGPTSTLCLSHASKERVNLNRKISHTKHITDSHGTIVVTKALYDIARKMSRNRVTNADYFVESDTELDEVATGSPRKLPTALSPPAPPKAINQKRYLDDLPPIPKTRHINNNSSEGSEVHSLNGVSSTNVTSLKNLPPITHPRENYQNNSIYSSYMRPSSPQYPATQVKGAVAEKQDTENASITVYSAVYSELLENSTTSGNNKKSSISSNEIADPQPPSVVAPPKPYTEISGPKSPFPNTTSENKQVNPNDVKTGENNQEKESKINPILAQISKLADTQESTKLQLDSSTITQTVEKTQEKESEINPQLAQISKLTDTQESKKLQLDSSNSTQTVEKTREKESEINPILAQISKLAGTQESKKLQLDSSTITKTVEKTQEKESEINPQLAQISQLTDTQESKKLQLDSSNSTQTVEKTREKESEINPILAQISKLADTQESKKLQLDSSTITKTVEKTQEKESEINPQLAQISKLTHTQESKKLQLDSSNSTQTVEKTQEKESEINPQLAQISQLTDTQESKMLQLDSSTSTQTVEKTQEKESEINPQLAQISQLTDTQESKKLQLDSSNSTQTVEKTQEKESEINSQLAQISQLTDTQESKMLQLDSSNGTQTVEKTQEKESEINPQLAQISQLTDTQESKKLQLDSSNSTQTVEKTQENESEINPQLAQISQLTDTQEFKKLQLDSSTSTKFPERAITPVTAAREVLVSPASPSGIEDISIDISPVATNRQVATPLGLSSNQQSIGFNSKVENKPAVLDNNQQDRPDSMTPIDHA